jgi:aminopeptidase N
VAAPGGQAQTFTAYDSLRGSLHSLRSCFDVKHYSLSLEVTPHNRFIRGHNIISFETTRATREIQIDLYENMIVDSIVFEGYKLPVNRNKDIINVRFNQTLPTGSTHKLKICYQGQPMPAKNPPWDGGFVWARDKNLNDWVGVACESVGASLWWPCKDHPSDKADSVTLNYIVPARLTAVGNGKLTAKKALNDSTMLYIWKTTKPILPYNVTFNLGDYHLITDQYKRADGSGFPMHFYVLSYNISKARQQFKQAHRMWSTFEALFGPYPFAEDMYKVVETPYLGMEHQSCIAYGDEFKNNAFDFDFILIHESAHEYWGNSVSMYDHADMWIHEAFCTYAEALYVEKLHGRERANAYLLTQKKRIKNKSVIQGQYGVNYNLWQDADMYFKGTWMLHTIRNAYQISDSAWLCTFFKIQSDFRYKHINREEIEAIFRACIGVNISKVLTAYLNHTEIPTMEFKIADKNIHYRWSVKHRGFDMPLLIKVGNEEIYLNDINNEWHQTPLPANIPLKQKNINIQIPEERFLVKLQKL